MLTNGSAKYNPMANSILNYYYEAFQVRTVVASNYTFSIESNIGACGYLYSDKFYPVDPSCNLISKTDDCDSGKRQCELTVFLEPWANYILVVTTALPEHPGVFNIVAMGPANIAIRHVRK